MNHDQFTDNETQFELSYELLYLLGWLAEHESEAFRNLIQQAIQQGFKKNMPKRDSVDALFDATVQHGVTDFFNLLGNLLAETLHEEESQQVWQKYLFPAVNHIDSTSCDSHLVTTSLEETTLKLERHPEKDPKEMLCRTLLKRWKPHKKTILN